jgi:hypothetical protein
MQVIINAAAAHVTELLTGLGKDFPCTKQCALAPEIKKRILKEVLDLDVIAHPRDVEDSAKRWPLRSHPE